MQVDVGLILEAYKEKLEQLTNENVLLKAQLKQLQNELDKNESNQ